MFGKKHLDNEMKEDGSLSVAVGNIEITPLGHMKEKLLELAELTNGGMPERVLREIVATQSREQAVVQIAHTLYIQRKNNGIHGSEVGDILAAAEIYQRVDDEISLSVNRLPSEIPFKIIKEGEGKGLFNYMITPRTMLRLPSGIDLPGTYGEGIAHLSRTNGNWDTVELRFLHPTQGGHMILTGGDFRDMQTLGWSGFPAARSLLNVNDLVEHLGRLENQENKEKIKEFKEILKKDGKRIFQTDFSRLTGDDRINIKKINLDLPAALTQNDGVSWTMAGHKDYVSLKNVMRTKAGMLFDLDGHTHPGEGNEVLNVASLEDIHSGLLIPQRSASYGSKGRPHSPLVVIAPMRKLADDLVVEEMVGYNLGSLIGAGDGSVDRTVQNIEEVQKIFLRIETEGGKPGATEQELIDNVMADIQELKISMKDSPLLDLSNKKPWSSC